MQKNQSQNINYDEIYLTKPGSEFTLNPSITIKGADLLSRKLGEFGNYVLFAHKMHYKVGDFLMPYKFTGFAIYDINEYRKNNYPLSNHINSFKPSYARKDEHTVLFKTNTALHIVQPSMYRNLSADKAYFMFDNRSDSDTIASTPPESIKNANHLEIVNTIIEKSNLLNNREIFEALIDEIKSLKNDIYFYNNELENIERANMIQEQINVASRVPSFIFPVVYKNILSDFYKNNIIKHHAKEIEFFTGKKIAVNKHGDYKPNNQQLKELYMSCMYEEKQYIVDNLSEQYETTGIDIIKSKFQNSVFKFKLFLEAAKKLSDELNIEVEQQKTSGTKTSTMSKK